MLQKIMFGAFGISIVLAVLVMILELIFTGHIQPTYGVEY